VRRPAPRPASATLVRALVGAVLPLVLCAALVPLRGQVNLVSDMLLFLALTVLVAMLAGAPAAIVAAVVGSLLVNYFFTPPLHTLAVRDANNALAIVVFLALALVVSTAVDLAERRRREAARVRVRLAEEAAGNKMRTALLAAVGHDLRTPLAAAKASVSSLRSQEVHLAPGDRDELVATADESLDTLAGLVDDLLDLSRLQAGALRLELRPVGVEEVVGRTLTALGAEAGAVHVDLADGLPAVACDPGLLERVLVNLVVNALRYAPDKRAPVITARADGDRVRLLVIDRGPGIPEADRERVFRPFQRLGDTDNTTGVGLGLALARGLTEAMDGTLTPGTTGGGGLTMTVDLPAAPGAGAAPGSAAEPGRVEREDRS
jgi:two-component system sensor histidine kinase KdpD